MMKQVWKKAMAVTLAGTMALSMAGCSSKTTSQTAGESKESGTAEAGEGKASISMMVTQFYGNELKNDHSDEVIKKFEDYTNTNVDFRWEANDTYNEKLGLVLMDKDNMPMIITGKGDLSANVVDAAKKGAFWDLSEFIKDSASYPNLSKADPQVLKSMTVDGKVIGLYRAREIGRFGFSYRTDWAEAVGITQAPKTVEDVYNMLYKFT